MLAGGARALARLGCGEGGAVRRCTVRRRGRGPRGRRRGGCGAGAANQCGTARAWERDVGEDGKVGVGGCSGCGIGQTPVQLYGGPHMTDKERRKSWRPTRFLLTGCSGGNDRTLSPRVHSTTKRSKSPQVTTGRVRLPLTGRSQSSVDPVYIFFA